jgi:hypothetical protein
MNPVSPVKQDLGWCPDLRPSRRADRFSFQGPFRYVTACLEKSGTARKNCWCLLFVTGSSMIVTPVPRALLHAEPVERKSHGEPDPALPLKRHGLPPDYESSMLERLELLVRQCQEAHPEEVFIAERDTDAIPLDTIKEIVIRRVRSSGRYFRLLFLFPLYPAEPANARYHVNYQLAITTGKRRLVVITPFSPELKEALSGLLGERVREIPDEYAPLL